MSQPDKERVNLLYDSFDKQRFTDMVLSSDLKDSVARGSKEYTQFPELTEDLFYSLFKYYPQMRDEAEIEKEFVANRTLIDKIQEHPHYNYTRAYSKLNEQTSAIGASTLGELILSENREQFEQMKKLEKEKQQLQQQMQKMAQGYKEAQANGNGQAAKTLKQKLKNAMQQQAQKAQQQTSLVNQIDVTGPLEQTNNSIQSQEEMLLTYGNEAGQASKVDFKTRLAFSKNFVNNARFAKIMKTLGRFKRLACKKQKEKVKHDNSEISDIIFSQNLQRMLPSEALLLLDPDLEPIFNKKFSESQLLSWDLTGFEEKAKGPIICCVDISGSMSGDKEVWAKGVALALVDIANRENRQTYLMLFDTSISLYCEFKGRKETQYIEKITKFAEHMTGGGTDFTAIIDKSISLLKTDIAYKKADVVLISDGCGSIREKTDKEFKQLKTERKINLINIVIGGSADQHTLHHLADQSVDVNHITDQKAGEIFEAI